MLLCEVLEHCICVLPIMINVLTIACFMVPNFLSTIDWPFYLFATLVFINLGNLMACTSFLAIKLILFYGF